MGSNINPFAFTILASLFKKFFKVVTVVKCFADVHPHFFKE